MTIKNYVYVGLVGLLPIFVNGNLPKEDGMTKLNYLDSVKIFEESKINLNGLGPAIEYHKSLSYQQIIKKMKVPAQVEWYLLNYLIPEAHPGNIRSFKKIHEKRFADCADATLASAIMLHDDGYKANYLLMWKDNKKVGHAVFYYIDEETQRIGSLGINKKDCNEPKFKNLNELVDFLDYDYYNVCTMSDEEIKRAKTKDQVIYTSKYKKLKKYRVKKQ